MTDIKQIVKSQREYFLSGQTRNEHFRKRNLEKLKNLLDKYQDRIIEALKKDLNKSSFEAHMTELSFVYEEINFAIKNLESWMKKERVITPMQSLPGRSFTFYEPLGVTLIISPWNYPVMLTIDPLVASIAAGNTSIIKTSKKTKNTSLVLQEMINENYPEEYIYLVDSNEVSHDYLLSQRYDHIFFTGSTEAGKSVMKKASENLTKVTLELGGKSPCIVDESADLRFAAKRIMWGKLLNAGQTCVAPDYLVVHKDVKERLLVWLKTYAIEYFGENAIINDDYPKIIDEKAFYRLTGLIQREDIYFGGRYDRDLLKIEPTIINNVSWNNKLMDKEIFGPILPVLEYEDIFDLINKIKNLEKPLALYIFSEDQAHIDRVLNDISYGSACLNDTIMQIASPYLEFGGVGNSGMGGYHGKYGFINFSNRKSLIERSTNVDINIRYAPYSKAQKKIIKAIEK